MKTAHIGRGTSTDERVLFQKVAFFTRCHTAWSILLSHMISNFKAFEGGKEGFASAVHF